eukprot:3662840-Alexandrium_andersonii.AAC.1
MKAGAAVAAVDAPAARPCTGAGQERGAGSCIRSSTTARAEGANPGSNEELETTAAPPPVQLNPVSTKPARSLPTSADGGRARGRTR